MSRRRHHRITGALTMVAVVFLWVPVLVVVLFSFNSTGGLSFPMRGLSLRWYREVFESEQIANAVRNSLIVGLTATALTMLLGTLAAVGLSRTRSRWRGMLAALYFVPLTLPGLFIGVSLLVFFREMSVAPSLRTVIAAHVVYVLPYYLLIVIAALQRIDPMLAEVAADLGAKRRQVFWKVTFPQVWPVIVGAGLLAFALSFDEVIITNFVIGTDSTLPMYVFSQLRRTVTPQINAIATMLLLAVLSLFTITAVFAYSVLRKRNATLAIVSEAS